MAQHTPGPWHRNIKPASKYPTIWSGRNRHVAAVVPGAPRFSGSDADAVEAEMEANICLITAAPDMLSALKSLVANPAFELSAPKIAGRAASDRRDAAVEAWNGFVDAARAAIAKAEGR